MKDILYGEKWRETKCPYCYTRFRYTRNELIKYTLENPDKRRKYNEKYNVVCPVCNEEIALSHTKQIKDWLSYTNVDYE